jgi:hypothetical protein
MATTSRFALGSAVLVAGVVATAASIAWARPDDPPCYVVNPAYTNACSHWSDMTNPTLCPDVISGTSDPCPGVMQGEPGNSSFTQIASFPCHIIQKVYNWDAGECEETTFDFPISCTQPSGDPCGSGGGGGND